MNEKEFRLLQKHVKAGKTPFFFRVVSGSMLPLIPIGSKLEIAPIGAAAEPDRFDILVFLGKGPQAGKLICHYLWNRNEWLGMDSGSSSKTVWVTRGLEGGEDLPIDRDRVLGRVVNFKISVWRRLRIVGRELLWRYRRQGVLGR